MAFHFVYGSQIISYVDINFPSGIVFPSILNSFSDIFPFSFNYVNYLNMLYIYYTFFSWSLLSLFLFSVFWNVFFQLCSTWIILFLPVSILYYTASNLVLGSILIVSALLNSFLRHGWNFFISIYIILSIFLFFIFSSVQSCSCVQLFATPWIAACQASLSITNSQSSLKLMSIESVMPGSCRDIETSSCLYPLSSPSPPALNPSQHQSLFQWVNSSHEVTKVLEFQLYHKSFQRTPRTDLLYNGLVGSPCSPRDSQESSPTPQFKSINSSVLSFLHNPTFT